MIEWMFKTQRDFGLKEETILIGVNLFDRSFAVLESFSMQLVAIGSLRIACKYEEILVNEIEDFLRVTQNQFSRKEVIHIEFMVMETVGLFIVQTCHSTVVERVRMLLDLEETFPYLAIYICKLGLLDSTIPYTNQYIFTISASVFAAEKAFNRPHLQKIAIAFGLEIRDITSFFPEIKRILLSNNQKYQCSARRYLLHRAGPGTVTTWEQLLLR